MSRLREILAERVEAARRDAAAGSQPEGAFTVFEDVAWIRFTTTGRRTGLGREKSWLPFAPWGDTVYLLEEAGTGADWVRNIQACSVVDVGGFAATARLVTDAAEDSLARSACRERFRRRGLLVADLIATGLVVVAFDV